MLHQAIEVDHHGRTIRGTVYRPERTGRVPAVLFLHGFTGHRMEAGFMFVQLARALAERGVAAVTFDFLHSGESDGCFDQMLVTGELADTLRMTQWLQAQPFADRTRLGLLGFSLGGLLACAATARTDAYQALTLLAPSTVENLSRLAGREQTEGRISVGPHVLHPDFFRDMRRLNPVADVIQHARPRGNGQAGKRPTLVLQGTADAAVPPQVSQAYVDALRRVDAPVDHELIYEADHTFIRLPHRQRLIERVVGWIGEHL